MKFKEVTELILKISKNTFVDTLMSTYVLQSSFVGYAVVRFDSHILQNEQWPGLKTPPPFFHLSAEDTIIRWFRALPIWVVLNKDYSLCLHYSDDWLTSNSNIIISRRLNFLEWGLSTDDLSAGEFCPVPWRALSSLTGLYSIPGALPHSL